MYTALPRNANDFFNCLGKLIRLFIVTSKPKKTHDRNKIRNKREL